MIPPIFLNMIPNQHLIYHIQNHNTNNPFLIDCPIISDPNTGGIPVLILELIFSFVLKDTTQTANNPNPYLTATLEVK